MKVAQFLAKHINAANYKRQNANAKEEVRQALEELLACRANPDQTRLLIQQVQQML